MLCVPSISQFFELLILQQLFLPKLLVAVPLSARSHSLELLPGRKSYTYTKMALHVSITLSLRLYTRSQIWYVNRWRLICNDSSMHYLSSTIGNRAQSHPSLKKGTAVKQSISHRQTSTCHSQSRGSDRCGRTHQSLVKPEYSPPWATWIPSRSLLHVKPVIGT